LLLSPELVHQIEQAEVTEFSALPKFGHFSVRPSKYELAFILSLFGLVPGRIYLGREDETE
jgi:hypothetical protein